MLLGESISVVDYCDEQIQKHSTTLNTLAKDDTADARPNQEETRVAALDNSFSERATDGHHEGGAG